MSGINAVLVGMGTPNASMPSIILAEDEAPDPGPSTASVSINSDGTYATIGNLSSASGVWKTGGGIGENYEARFNVVSSSFTGAAINTWLSLNTSRIWNLVQSDPGITTVTGTLQIRNAATTTVLTSCSVDMSAFVY